MTDSRSAPELRSGDPQRSAFEPDGLLFPEPGPLCRSCGTHIDAVDRQYMEREHVVPRCYYKRQGKRLPTQYYTEWSHALCNSVKGTNELFAPVADSNGRPGPEADYPPETTRELLDLRSACRERRATAEREYLWTFEIMEHYRGHSYAAVANAFGLRRFRLRVRAVTQALAVHYFHLMLGSNRGNPHVHCPWSNAARALYVPHLDTQLLDLRGAPYTNPQNHTEEERQSKEWLQPMTHGEQAQAGFDLRKLLVHKNGDPAGLDPRAGRLNTGDAPSHVVPQR